MTMPLVTIMIPTFNQEKYISDAVESALAQDYPNLEIIVADDFSKDSTEEIINKYKKDKRLRYIRNNENLGRVGNYHNCAHELAKGDWVINLDGDDYFTSRSFISDAITLINQEQDQDIVAYCYHHRIDIIKSIIPTHVISNYSLKCSGKDYFLNYYRYGGFAHNSIIWRRDVGLKIGMYLIPWQACDFHALIRVFINGRIILDSRTVAYWRQHGKNTSILQADNKQREAKLTFDAIENYAKNLCTETELVKWRKGINKSTHLEYINSHVFYVRNFKSLLLLLTNPHCKRWYFRAWFKLIFNR